jgi:hypothetical protein
VLYGHEFQCSETGGFSLKFAVRSVSSQCPKSHLLFGFVGGSIEAFARKK